ncbi:MAG TPA: ADP-ribosylglycohydrolase family protein [Planctomycetota bacterium]|nr:ADP-ribosylglycohydrolase family protein [Planctomycetota bacterium]
MPIPSDYEERVYAGVLGKIIGVYVGKPFEGWTYDRIMAELGEIRGYVHARFNRPVVELDDDIAGTFAFLRALADGGNSRDLTARQIGLTWLNTLIEERTVLWWGGLGASTEHTAYLRLKAGIPAPESGSIEVNGPVIAQQIGAQIFIDGWAMVAPGDPELAAELARKAASVSHDGEAVYGAQVVAAMEAQAFVESDVDKLIDCALGFIPKDSHIARMIGELRELYAKQPDWREARRWLATEYPYDRFGGGCPMVPNHGLIILALLYGKSSFAESLMIVNTSGWDTDCNSGNLGCLLGIKDGLATFDADGIDWRGPVADRLYVPTADAGAGVTDAAIEAYKIVNMGRALAGLEPVAPKGGARFHFELPGSVQGFEAERAEIANVARSLEIRAQGKGARAFTRTWARAKDFGPGGYRLAASPTLYAGQTVRAGLSASADNATQVACRLYVEAVGADDAPVTAIGDDLLLAPGASGTASWRVPDTKGASLGHVGVEVSQTGVVHLDYLTWDGPPETRLIPTEDVGTAWQEAWVNGVDMLSFGRKGQAVGLRQNRGTGLLIQGTREWTDYRVTAKVKTDLAAAAGIAARVQGMRRYYALVLCPGAVRLLKAFDDEMDVLAEAPLAWEFGSTHELALEVAGTHLRARVDGRETFDATDDRDPLTSGAVALVVEKGQLGCSAVCATPLGE